MADGNSNGDGRLTRGWKVAIVVALVVALANTGIDSLRNREDQRFQNHEKRVDELENKVRGLEAALKDAKAKADAK